MTPTQVVDALRSGNIETISGEGNEDFRANVSVEQLRRLWDEATARWGDLVNAGEAVVLHDLPLRFASGEAHLQIAYRGDRVAGLVLKPGPPTARFGE